MAGFDENESTTDVENRLRARDDPERFEEETMVDELSDALDQLSTGAHGQESEQPKSLDALRTDLVVAAAETPPKDDQTEKSQELPLQRPVMRELPPFEPVPLDSIALQGYRPGFGDGHSTPTELLGDRSPGVRGARRPVAPSRRGWTTLVMALVCLAGGVLLGRFTAHLPSGLSAGQQRARDAGTNSEPPSGAGPGPDSAPDPDLSLPDLTQADTTSADVAALPAAAKVKRSPSRRRRWRRGRRRRRRAPK